MKAYQVLARAIGARNRCVERNLPNDEWINHWQEQIDHILESFPSGSGFDKGTKLDEASTPEKLVFNTAFHHMDENGYYCGSTKHQVIVTPSLEFGFRIRITGQDKREIKDLIADYFNSDLDTDIPEHYVRQAVNS